MSVAGSVVGMPPGVPTAAAAAAKALPEPCLLLASRPLDVAAELVLQLEYTAGEGCGLSELDVAAASPVDSCQLQATSNHPHTQFCITLRDAAAGVWRSHSCCLQLPLQQPANVAAAALQLPGGRVALSITLSLEPNASSSLLLLEAALRPQYGLMLSGSSSSSRSGGLGLGPGGPCLGEVLPIRVLPGGSAGLCFMLMQDQGGCTI
jgi:hypothetical protein